MMHFTREKLAEYFDKDLIWLDDWWLEINFYHVTIFVEGLF
jgi:hypothetical protein